MDPIGEQLPRVLQEKLTDIKYWRYGSTYMKIKFEFSYTHVTETFPIGDGVMWHSARMRGYPTLPPEFIAALCVLV
jgi:hypothetical protein